MILLLKHKEQKHKKSMFFTGLRYANNGNYIDAFLLFFFLFTFLKKDYHISIQRRTRLYFN